jgi:hypothetical protein
MDDPHVFELLDSFRQLLDRQTDTVIHVGTMSTFPFRQFIPFAQHSPGLSARFFLGDGRLLLKPITLVGRP